jgi:asparaginyl-tRNA synthetase
MIRQRLLSSYASPLLFSAPRFTPTIHQLLAACPEADNAQGEHQVTVSGWIKSVRRQKNVSFAVVTDGSSATGLQAVFVGTGKDSGELKRSVSM